MMQIHLIHRKPRSRQYINYNCRGNKAYPQIKLRREARFETSRLLKTYQNGRISERTIKEPLYFSRIQQIQELFLYTICMNNNQVRNLYRQSLQFLINRIHIKTITNYLKKKIKKKKKKPSDHQGIKIKIFTFRNIRIETIGSKEKPRIESKILNSSLQDA
jgi:hypothetical protein